MLALHKIGAVASPRRINSLRTTLPIASRRRASARWFARRTRRSGAGGAGAGGCPELTTKILVGGTREGWHDFDSEYQRFSSRFERPRTRDCGRGHDADVLYQRHNGYPKIASHSCTYALGHFVTAKYWHQVQSRGCI
jgi:acetyl-CoA synthetase